MPTPPGKLRPFRPSALALEAICPVSSLATALPLAATAVAGEAGTTQARHQRPARGESASATIPSMRLTPRVAGGQGGRGVGGGPDIAMPSRTALNDGQQIGPVSGVNLGRYGNAITVEVANVPLARQPSAPAAGQDTGGGGVSAPVIGDAASLIDSSTTIRPMTLAATQGLAMAPVTDGMATEYDTSMGGSDSGSMGGSDSGSGFGSGSGSSSDSGFGSGSGSSSDSQSSIDFRAWITGVGKHPDDSSVSWDDSSGDAPEQTQGEAWMSGGGTAVILRDAATGDQMYNWTLEKATWTLPGAMIKGYGEFSEQYERSDDPSDIGAYTAFSGDPVETAEVKAFDADDLEYKDGTLETNDHVFSEAFFGADAVGEVTISVTATFRNMADPQKKVTKSDNVKVVSIKPKGLMTRKLFGTAAGVAPINNNTEQILQFDKTFPANYGVLYECTVDTTSADGKALSPGIFKVAQTVDRTATRQKTEGGVLTEQQHPLKSDKTSPGKLCDKDPYRGNVDDPNNARTVGDTAEIGHKFYFNDSPGMEMDTGWDKYTIKDKLQATLMYKPSSSGRRGIYIPVAMVNWSWEGNAVRQGAIFVDAANPAPTADATSTPTTQPPAYTEKIGKYLRLATRNPKWVQTSP